jgi:hypothetical protein
MKPPKNWYEQRQVLTACVDRWAARMSFGPDTATEVADATVAACDLAIEYEQQNWAKEQKVEPNLPAARAYWRGQALYRAVQWRAGKCPMPD